MSKLLKDSLMLHAEKATQVYSLGGGISLDSLNRLKIFGVENLARKNARKKSANKRNVTRKKRMSSISLEKILKKTSRPRRNLKSWLSTTRKMLPNWLLRNLELLWKSRDSNLVRTSKDLLRRFIKRSNKRVSLGRLVSRSNLWLLECNSLRSVARLSMLLSLLMTSLRRSLRTIQRRSSLLTSNLLTRND